MKGEYQAGAPSKLHPRQFCFRWNKDKLGGDGGGGGHDGSPVLLTRDRNSKLGSHQVGLLAGDLHREIGAKIGSSKLGRVMVLVAPGRAPSVLIILGRQKTSTCHLFLVFFG